MRALFVSIYSDTPHFETELELIADLLADGHEVRVLRCEGALAACLRNPFHLPSICAQCGSKVDRGLGAIAHPRLSIEVLVPIAIDPRLQRDFASTEALKTYEFEGSNLGRGACASTCALVHKDTQLDTRKHADLIWRQLCSAYQIYMGTRRAIDGYSPDRVYLFNGRFATCHPIVLACRERGVDFYTHERGATAGHYLLRKNHLPHDLGVAHEEILALWAAAGAEREQIARSWYEKRRSGSEEAWLSYTKAQTRGLLPEGFDRGRRNIAIFNSTMEEYDTIVQDPGIYPDEVVGLRRIVEDLRSEPGLHLWLRVHPNLQNIPRDDNYQLRDYAKLARESKNLTIIWPESVVHSYALLDACDTAFTFSSTMGAEAAFWGRPSVLGGRSFYEGLDCCHRPGTHDELLALLKQPLVPKTGDGALKYGYWEAEKGIRYKRFAPTGLFTGTFDGQVIESGLPARLWAAGLRVLGR